MEFTVICALALAVFLTAMWIDLNIRIERVENLLKKEQKCQRNTTSFSKPPSK